MRKSRSSWRKLESGLDNYLYMQLPLYVYTLTIKIVRAYLKFIILHCAAIEELEIDDQVGEVGELSEIFQWRGEVPRGLPGWKEDEKEHLGEELSDVLLYLVRLSDICGIDLGKAVLNKLHLNAVKYPVHLCKGSSMKYNDNRNDIS